MVNTDGPCATNINALILDTVKLLQSPLGAHIEIESRVAPEVWTALVDPHNWLQRSLINLALNAAMRCRVAAS